MQLIALAQSSHKYAPLLGSLLVCIYIGSLLGLFPLAVCTFQGCIFIQGPKIMYNYFFVATAFKFYSSVLRWFSFILNSIILYVEQTWQFSSSRQLCILILLFSSQRYVTWNSCFLQNTRKMSLFFGDKRKKVKYLTKKWKRNDFVFSQNAKILIMD